MNINRTALGYLVLKVHRKDTHNDKYLDFNSTHLLNDKESVARTLFQRSYNLYDYEFIQEKHENMTEALQINNHPKNVINRVKSKVIQNKI